MRKRAIAKSALAILETLSIVILVVTVLWAIPTVRDYFAVRITFVQEFVKFWQPGEWLGLPVFAAYPDIYGLALFVIIILVLQLLTIWPLVALARQKDRKPEGAVSLASLKVDDADSSADFVDGEGNFGTVKFKGKLQDPRAKYFRGLNPVQADQEFDWRNYTNTRPVVRIVLGVILGILALALLGLRFGWYVSDANSSIASFYSASWLNGVMTDLDQVSLHLFRSLGYIQVGAIGNAVITAKEVCDFVFWILICYTAIMLILIVVTAVIWLFRKPVGKKRAAKARERYYASLANKTFVPVFNDEIKYLAVGIRPQSEVEGESLPADGAANIEPATVSISQIGTGVDWIEPVQINVLGNVLTGSVLSFTLSEATDDMMLIDPTLLSTIADFAQRSYAFEPALKTRVDMASIARFTPRFSAIEIVKEDQTKLLASDRLPAYWYLHAVRRPSDLQPAHWFENAQVTPVVPAKSASVAAVAPASESHEITSAVPVHQGDLDTYILLANALEPLKTTPVQIEGTRPAPVAIHDWEKVQALAEKKARDQATLVESLRSSASSVQSPELPVQVFVPSASIKPSMRTASYWLTVGLNEALNPAQEIVTTEKVFVSGLGVREIVHTRFIHSESAQISTLRQRVLVEFLEPETLVSAPVAGAETGVITHIVTLVAITPVIRSAASNKGPDYWYELAAEELGASAVKPIVYPAPVAAAVEPAIGVVPVYGNRPADKTPDYWYALAGDEVFAPVTAESSGSVAAPVLPVDQVAALPVLPASERQPEHWYEQAVRELVAAGVQLPQPLPAHATYVSGTVSGYVGNLASGNLASGNLASGQLVSGMGRGTQSQNRVIAAPESVIVSAREQALSEFVEPAHLIPAAVAGAAAKVEGGAQTSSPVESIAPASISAIGIAPVITGAASNKGPDYWYELAADETARALPFYYVIPDYLLKAADRTPDYWYGNVVIAPVFPVPAAQRSTDYWYALAFDENSKAAPFVFVPASAVKKVVAPIEAAAPALGIIPEYGNRPADKTPEYWYALAGDETFAPATTEASGVVAAPILPVSKVAGLASRASERLPEFWYEQAVRELIAAGVQLPQPLPVHATCVSGVSGYVGNLASGYSGNLSSGVEPVHGLEEIAVSGATGVESVQLTSSEQALSEFVEPAHLIPAAVAGAAVAKAEPVSMVESPAASAPVIDNVASNKNSDYWYELAADEAAAAQPFDFIPAPRLDIPKAPVVGPVPTIHEPVKPVSLIKPVKPIKPIKPVAPVAPVAAESEPVAPATPKVVGPIGLAHAKSKPAAIKITPVAARKVRFQLKTMGATYNGKLTPEEAFARAITNQSVVVNPFFNDANSTDSKYLAKRKQSEKNKARKTGYVSATVVSDLKGEKRADAIARFDKPVSAFGSIREWAKAKKEFEAAQRAKLESAKTSPEAVKPKIKPIAVVRKPVVKAAETKVNTPEKGPVKPIAPLRPLKPNLGRTIQPIKPIKPIQVIKKNTKEE